MAHTLAVRPSEPNDLPALLAIENSCFSDPWSARQLEEDVCLVATADSRVVGFLVFHHIDAAEGEILNLAVHPAFRRSGIASLLLQHHLQETNNLKKTWFLEVRESNQAARALYRAFGFAEVGRRPRYYRLPSETAIVMRWQKC